MLHEIFQSIFLMKGYMKRPRKLKFKRKIEIYYLSYGWDLKIFLDTLKILEKQFWKFSRYLSNDKILALLLTFAPRAVKNNHNRLHETAILKEITFIDTRITIIVKIYNPLFHFLSKNHKYYFWSLAFGRKDRKLLFKGTFLKLVSRNNF